MLIIGFGTVYIVILFFNISYFALGGLVIIILVMILNIFISTLMGKLTAIKLKLNGQRNKEINFSIGGIKTLKFNGWEKITIDFLNNIRIKEKNTIIKIIFLSSMSNIITYVLPSLAGFMCIVLYNSFNDNLKIGDIFFIITIFNLLVTPLRVFFFGTMKFFEAKVSIKRISRMLLLPNFDDNDDKYYLNNNDLQKGEIIFDSATFSYNDKTYEKNLETRIKSVIGEIIQKKKGAKPKPGI